MSTRAKSSANEFGALINKHLAARDMTQRGLATASEQSPAYLNHVLTGKRNPSPRWCDLVADSLGLDDDGRYALHLEAARRQGFKV